MTILNELLVYLNVHTAIVDHSSVARRQGSKYLGFEQLNKYLGFKQLKKYLGLNHMVEFKTPNNMNQFTRIVVTICSEFCLVYIYLHVQAAIVEPESYWRHSSVAAQPCLHFLRRSDVQKLDDKSSIEAPIKTPWTGLCISRQYGTEGFEGAFNQDYILPRGVTISDDR